jgi:pSer/pThr/pTyr-binding forkhead associated (FHA) protein
VNHGLLEILKYFLLGLLWLFFLYAARMVFVEVRRSRRSEGTDRSGAPARRPERDANLQLRVLEPTERRGKTFDVIDELTVGRSSACLIPLEDDTYASSVHARVYARGGEYFVEDLGSTNGTYLNNKRLSSATPLHRGDRVRVGSTIFEVRR